MKELSAEACKQGELWGHGARDWMNIQERHNEPLWNAVLDAAEVGAGTRFLDAGCGSGGASALAASRGAEVFGVDPSVNLITLARERLPRSDFRIGELGNLPFSNAEFDAAVAINSMQYVPNPQLAMHELARVCREGGRVVVAVFADPEFCDTAQIFRAIAGLFDKPPSSAGPFALSSAAALESLAASVPQLSVDSIRDVDCPREYPDLETALRGQMAAGATQRSVEILGADRVRAAIREVLQRFHQPGGQIRLMNRFRYLVALKSGEGSRV